MENINVIFDFQCNIGNIADFILELPASVIPRKGEGVKFDVEHLQPLCESMKEYLEQESVFEVHDVTWYYHKQGIREVRVFLKEIQD